MTGASENGFIGVAASLIASSFGAQESEKGYGFLIRNHWPRSQT